MRTSIGCVVVLVGALGIVMDAAAAPEKNPTLAPFNPQAVLNNPGYWSKGDAAILLGSNTDPASGALPRSYPNNQRAALMSFLSLYDITQRDTKDANGVKIDTGSWDALQIQNGGNLGLDIRTALFGNGSQSSGMISEVIVGGTTTTQNPLRSIRAALDKLGVPNHNLSPHQNHFHIYLRPPEIMPIGGYSQPKLLQAVQAVSSSDSLTPLSENSPTSGETEMFMSLFVPALPPMQEAVAAPPAIVQMAANTTKPDMIFDGGCNVAQTPDTPSTDLKNGFFPAGQVGWYFSNVLNTQVDVSKATVKVIKNPQHGALLQLSLEEAKKSVDAPLSGPLYRYQPNSGYLGADDATLLVELDGKSYKIHTKFYVVKEVNDNEFYGQGTPATLCANSELKRVATLTFNQDINLAQWGDIVQEIATSAVGMEFNQYIATASGVTLNFANLMGGAIGQAVGEGTNATITLDTNASGYNWFIDTTPADNSEFLPTSNPNEWVAKAGSAAAGKMDMLSVLLHEYGHALGIDHSANPNDFMGTTLTAGVRRLPSAEEMALMHNLISQAKTQMTATSSTPGDAPAFPTLPLGTSFIGFLGLLRGSRYGGLSIAPDASTLVTQYAVAANATLTNGSLNAADGWATQGSVDIGNGAATMREVSASQTRLSQVFILNDKDRYLSFTLAGSALDNLTGAPDDAFEVALLDANTGLSVLGGDGLTRTDAFLNLQADGTQYAANCVTCTFNPDGSRTYRVDLTGVAKNSAVNLSFDLLGFGASNSHATLRDIRVSGLPQLHDDVATILEDGTLSFDPFAQADSQLRPLLASHVVDAPTHGAITVNADGTFSYTPATNYNGADSFTYRLSDGPLDSNLATVNLTITSVNDAPQGANATVTTLEDTAYVFQVSDFGFSDANDAGSGGTTSQSTSLANNASQVAGYIAGANNFSAVTISSLPLSGTLTNNGVAVVAGQSITVADVNQ